MMTLLLILGFTLFPGNPHWYELNTRGVEWTVSDLSDPNVLGVPLTLHQQEENE